jgi:hypothetical protein
MDAISLLHWERKMVQENMDQEHHQEKAEVTTAEEEGPDAIHFCDVIDKNVKALWKCLLQQDKFTILSS